MKERKEKRSKSDWDCFFWYAETLHTILTQTDTSQLASLPIKLCPLWCPDSEQESGFAPKPKLSHVFDTEIYDEDHSSAPT